LKIKCDMLETRATTRNCPSSPPPVDVELAVGEVRGHGFRVSGDSLALEDARG